MQFYFCRLINFCLSLKTYLPFFDIALEEIFKTATETVTSINGCPTNLIEDVGTSFDIVKGCEVLSGTTPKYTQCAKGISEVGNYLKNDNEYSSCTISSNCVESVEKPDKKELEENGNSKTSSDCFDSDWEFKQDTLKVGKEQLFLSLASHNGKLLSFSDNDHKHGSLKRDLGKNKGMETTSQLE